MARRRRSHRAKKNFVPLVLPFLPFILPVAVTGVGLYAAKKAIGTAAEPYIRPPAIAGASLGYVASAVTKQSGPVQFASALGGYLAGYMLGNWAEERKIQRQIEQVSQEQGISKSEAEKQVANQKWCDESPILSWLTPSCY